MLRDNYLFKTASPLKMEPIGCPETSLTNYQSRLRKIPEEARSHFHRDWSLKLHKVLIPFPWLFACGSTWSCLALLSVTINFHSSFYQTWKILRRKSYEPKKSLKRKTNSYLNSWRNFSRFLEEDGVNNISKCVSANPSPCDWLKLGMPLIRELMYIHWKPSSFLRLPLATMYINEGTVLIAAEEQGIASISHKTFFLITSISVLMYYYCYWHYHHNYS
jgi:hypothetical protein